MLLFPNSGGTIQPTPDTLAKRDSEGVIASTGLKLSDDNGRPEAGFIRYLNKIVSFHDGDGWVDTATTGDFAVQGHDHNADDITAGQLNSDRLPDTITKDLSVAPNALQAFFYFGSSAPENINNDRLVFFQNANNRRGIIRYQSNQGFRNFVSYAYGSDETEIGTSSGTVKLLGTNLASGTATSSNSLVVENGLVTSITTDELTWGELIAITEMQQLVNDVSANAAAIASHGHDWDDLPETNSVEKIHTVRQIFKGAPAVRVESNVPTVELFDTTPGSPNWRIQTNEGVFAVHADLDDDGVFDNFNIIRLQPSTQDIKLLGQNVWHSGNFDSNNYWNKSELPRLIHRYSGAYNRVQNFLKVLFDNASAVAVYQITLMAFGGSVGNYNNFTSETFEVIVEPNYVIYSPASTNTFVFSSHSNNEATLSYELSLNQNNLAVNALCVWGVDWAGHSIG